MSFRHKDHKHQTVAEARLCEQGRETTTTVSVGGVRREAQHQTPCVCGPYDKCREFRLADARGAGTANGAIRAMHRAYND